MEKGKLERFISKYYLGGAVPSVIWQSNGNEVYVKGITDSKDAMVMITLSEPVVPEGKYGVYDTSKLSSMLNVLGSDVTAEVKQFDGKNTGITFSDSNETIVDYALADESAIPGAPEVKQIPAFDVVIELDQQFIASYLRATSALSEVTEFTVVSDGSKTQVVVGHSSNNTNKITINARTTEAQKISPIKFSAKLFKEILSANKNNSGVMKITSKGISHISFIENGFVTNYYLIVKQEA
jgi:hypothetical protein